MNNWTKFNEFAGSLNCLPPCTGSNLNPQLKSFYSDLGVIKLVFVVSHQFKEINFWDHFIKIRGRKKGKRVYTFFNVSMKEKNIQL